MKKKEELTQARLKELLYYDQKTGIFTWKESRRCVKKDDVSGTLDSKGYVIIMVDRIRYKAHRLAWFYIYGVWPKNDIDHINTIRHHNFIVNLREATRGENLQNQTKAHKDNK